eukprot:6199158-Pleurochrysis_carterae.AAC.1
MQYRCVPCDCVGLQHCQLDSHMSVQRCRCALQLFTQTRPLLASDNSTYARIILTTTVVPAYSYL